MSKILQQIEKLATKTAESALSKEAKLGERIEALKVLTPIYTLLKKSQAKEEEPEETTMAALQAELERAEDGEVLRSRRRPDA